MVNTEISKVENEIKFMIRHQAPSNTTQASSTSLSNTMQAASASLSSTDAQSITSSNTNEPSKIINKKKSLINYFLDSLTDEDAQPFQKQSSTLNKTLNEEFKAYKKIAAHYVSLSSDTYEPMEFWKTNKLLLPNLVSLAQKYLASPSTSTKSESAFSMSGYYGRKQRARLSPENLGFSVFLKDKLSNGSE